MPDEIVTQSTPVRVEVVPPPPKPTMEERILKHVENTPTLPTLTHGDMARREPAPQAPAPTVEQEAPGDAAPETAEEHYEFEFKEKKWQVPKDLKELHEGYLRQEDYTKKTQETADIRRSAELMLQQAKDSQALQQALSPHIASLQTVNERINQYQKVDWNALIAQDPVESQKHFTAYQVLKDQKAQLEEGIRSSATQHMQKINENLSKIREATDKVLQNKIKGWNPEKGKNLNEFVKKTYGFNDTEVNTTVDARVIEMMHDAQAWRQLQESKPQKVVVPEKTIKPKGTENIDAAKAKEAEIKADIRRAKTDTDRAKAVQRLLEHRVR